MTKQALINQVKAIKAMCDRVLSEEAAPKKEVRKKPMTSEDYCQLRREKLLNKKPRQRSGQGL